jgi:hypothetical protein
VVACGALRPEIEHLAARNGWDLEGTYLAPSLHVALPSLARAVSGALAPHRGHGAVVGYGRCHPAMDQLVAAAGAVRVAGQSCLEMLLGRERYEAELLEGAYFLLECWAGDFMGNLCQTFGADWEMAREIFLGHCRVLVAVRTPCSGNFHEAAEEAARAAGLPLRWLDADLDHLEQVLREAMARREPAAPPRAGEGSTAS